MFSLIDTHAHLDELTDLDSKLEEAKRVGIVAIVAVGSGYESNIRTLEIAQKYQSFVYPALGLHPWELGKLTSSQLEYSLQFIEENVGSAIAVGEIGLDYDKRVLKEAPKELQKRVLTKLLSIAKDYAKPVAIHSRYAWNDALQIAKQAGVEKAIFHWFTGLSSVLESIIDSGYYISATPASEYHGEHRRAVKEVPLDRLLLETDCPVTYGREIRYQSRPTDVLRSLRAVSEIRGIEEDVVAEQTTRNAIRFFALDTAL